MSQAKLVIANHLSTALDLLGYENNQPKEWRYGLVSQIALFAGVTKNEDLELEANNLLKSIAEE